MEYPFALHRVAGDTALATLQNLRASGTGIALILGDQECLERMQEIYEINQEQSSEELIAQALALDVPAWLSEREAMLAQDYADEDEGDEGDYGDEDEESEPFVWPEASMANHHLSAHCDVLTGEPYEEVILTVVPVQQAWMVPCYLHIGGWNEMPQAHEHAALFKYWGEQYGALVASIADDVIEMTVSKPPRTKEEAMALARQHYIYCPDIVDQGTESVEALAATLLDASVWFFWWD